MGIYKNILRPILFQLDPEKAHDLARVALRRPGLVQPFVSPNLVVSDPRLGVQMGGLSVPNPVGLSAGFDKDADMADALSLFGFGYVVSGSIMCEMRPGNPKPRMVRDPGRQAIYSCMGLPSRGLEYAVRHLQRRKHFQTPLVLNFNAETYGGYIRAFEALQPFGEALELSLYCPNRPADAGDFLEPDTARALLTDILSRKQKPLFIKVPGYATEDDRRKRLALIESFQDLDIDGVSITPASRVGRKTAIRGPRHSDRPALLCPDDEGDRRLLPDTRQIQGHQSLGRGGYGQRRFRGHCRWSQHSGAFHRFHL